MSIPVLVATLACLVAGPMAFERQAAAPADRNTEQKKEPPYKPGNGVSYPEVVKEVPAVIESNTPKEPVEGVVQVSLVVNTEGVPEEVKVARPLHPALDAAAVKAVEQYRFKPGMKDGKPVPVQIVLGIAFNVTQDNRKAHGPGGDMTTPEVVTEVKPEYPQELKDKRVQGDVGLSCLVGVDGVPTEIAVTKSLHPTLDEAAKKALTQWRFKPGRKGDKPVPIRVDLEINFSLK